MRWRSRTCCAVSHENWFVRWIQPRSKRHRRESGFPTASVYARHVSDRRMLRSSRATGTRVRDAPRSAGARAGPASAVSAARCSRLTAARIGRCSAGPDYSQLGQVSPAYRAVGAHEVTRLRQWLCRRRQVEVREVGALSGRRAVCGRMHDLDRSRMPYVSKFAHQMRLAALGAGDWQVRFDEREEKNAAKGETETSARPGGVSWERSATATPSGSRQRAATSFDSTSYLPVRPSPCS